jgi:7,8-dihydropterin-6-yl-methyl-4-(beta-D-ribofuranosyl)aminobenzene 5'-phosphate synthase
VVNTVRHIINISGCDRIHALIGGMHLPNSSHERLEKTARFLRELDAKILLPCHCSGNKIQGLI